MFVRDWSADVCAQDPDHLSVSITGNSGGNFENVATAGTVLARKTAHPNTCPVPMSHTTPCFVEEGSTITHRAQGTNAVTDTDLVLTLSNGQKLTIAVGQTVGTVDYVVRGDDAYVQGTDHLSVSITGNRGGNFEIGRASCRERV